MRHTQKDVLRAFDAFDVDLGVRAVVDGPTLRTYMLDLRGSTRINRVRALEDDVAARLGVPAVRLSFEGGQLRLEVPRGERKTVHPRWPKGEGELSIPFGVDTLGNWRNFDLTKAPHLLVAGTTGSGKSIFLHALIQGLLMQDTPVALYLVDPKQLEFGVYEKFKRGVKNGAGRVHNVVTEAFEARQVFEGLVAQMEQRFRLLKAAGARDLKDYREKTGTPVEYGVVVIDEWADLIMTDKRVEAPLIRLAQKARAAGIHVVLATQRPTTKVVSGLVKANFPARVALRVGSKTDSRVVLDANGAEGLLGRGDMLVSGFGLQAPLRMQGAFINT